jgi:hypothetical protein
MRGPSTRVRTTILRSARSTVAHASAALNGFSDHLTGLSRLGGVTALGVVLLTRSRRRSSLQAMPGSARDIAALTFSGRFPPADGGQLGDDRESLVGDALSCPRKAQLGNMGFAIGARLAKRATICCLGHLNAERLRRAAARERSP